MKRAALVLALACAAAAAFAIESVSIAPFSAAQPGGELPAPWSVQGLPLKKATEFSLVRDAGVTVLRARSEAAVGSAIHRLQGEARTATLLKWRWKVDRTLDKADLGTREGDDFAARVYVSFDVPIESLSFADRTKLRLARLVYGDDLPVSAICYVWDNSHPVGTAMWSPYSDRLWMVVVQSGNARAGEWVAETRDVEADFRAGFGSGPMPAINGVAVAADTDQTGESVTAWFGDVKLEAPR